MFPAQKAQDETGLENLIAGWGLGTTHPRAPVEQPQAVFQEREPPINLHHLKIGLATARLVCVGHELQRILAPEATLGAIWGPYLSVAMAALEVAIDVVDVLQAWRAENEFKRRLYIARPVARCLMPVLLSAAIAPLSRLGVKVEDWTKRTCILVLYAAIDGSSMLYD